MRAICGRFLEDRSGATAIEYCIIVAVLSLAIVGGIGKAFDAIGYMWGDSNGQIQNAID